MTAQDELRLREALTIGLAAWLCFERHGADGGGHCVNCRSRAEQIGIPFLLPVVLADREKAVQQARAEVVERVEAAIAAEDGWQVPGQPEYVSAEAVRAALREAQP